LERAEGLINTALEYYRRNDMRHYISRPLRLLADLHDMQGRSSEARYRQEEAERLASEFHVV
jgi:hypothetical protein